MSILHPYNFVPFASTLNKKPLKAGVAAGHERYRTDGHYSGTFTCVLKTLTPLCLKAHFAGLAAGSTAYLPGSSLRGLVRNTAEMLGAGCTAFYRDGEKRPEVKGFEACGKENACLVCRVFGYSAEQEDLSWQGKVRFFDSERTEGVKWGKIPGGGTARWQNYGAKHTPFYFEDEQREKPRGWKVYRHARKVTAAANEFAGAVCVPAEQEFQFRALYENLDDEELAVFRFALTLEHECAEHAPVRLCHKFGYGKGIGLGSCEIRIEKDERVEPKRYFPRESSGAETAGACPLGKYFAEPGFAAMQEYLDWMKAPERIEFPGFGWFRKQGHLGGFSTIEDYEADKNQLPRPQRKAAPGAAGGGGAPRKGATYTLGERNEEKPGGLAEETPLPIGKKVEVEVTATSKKWATCLTVREYWGKRCEGRFPMTPWVIKGQRCKVKIIREDEATHTFEGSGVEAL